MEKITLYTQDRLKLSALWWKNRGARAVLLLHMMPATKESWVPLAEKLATRDFNVLALDFRGHGDSEGGDYKTFSSEDHQKYYLDAQAGMQFLNETFSARHIFMGGASIGANIVLQYMAEYHEITKGVALSAGLDYYGVRAIDFAPKLDSDQQVLLAAVYDDERKSGNCGKMAEQLFDATKARKQKLIFETGGHGTDMFNEHPDLENTVVEFLAN